MGPITTIEFLGPSINGATVSLVWIGAGGTTASATETFVPTRTTNFQSSISTDKNAQAQFFYNALIADYGANFTISYLSNKVFVQSTNTNNPVNIQYAGTNILIGQNVTNFIFQSNPQLGYGATFSLDVPGLISSTYSITFVNPVVTPSNEVLLGSDVNVTSNNMQTWLSNFITTYEPTLASYSTIYHTNTLVNPFNNAPTDILAINYVKTYRYKMELTANPTNGTRFVWWPTKNGSPSGNFDRTVDGSLNNFVFVQRGANGNITQNNLLTNLTTYHSSATRSFSLSPTVNSFGFYDLYVDVLDNASNVWGLNVNSNNTTWNITGPIVIPTAQVVQDIYIPAPSNLPAKVLDILDLSPMRYITPGVTSSACAIYDLITGANAVTFTYDSCVNGNTITQIVATNSTDFTSCAVQGTVNMTGAGGTYSIDTTCDGIFNFDTSIYKIKTWQGNILDEPSYYDYEKPVQKVISTQKKTYINLSPLVKEKIEGDIYRFYITSMFPDFTQTQPIGIKESKWVKVDTDYTLLGVTASNSSQDVFFCLDGWVKPEVTQSTQYSNIPDILTSDRFASSTTSTRMYLKSRYITSVNWTASTGVTGSIINNVNPENSNEYISFIEIERSYPQIRYDVLITAPSSMVQYTVNYEFYDPCKYYPYDIVYKNKYGVLEALSVSKKSSKSISTENESYLRSIVDYNGDLVTSRHTNKTLNHSMNETWILNTEFMPEYMNGAMEELMASNEIWLVDPYGAEPKPVILVDKELGFKTHLNDKLIQYTIKVKFSHDTINNIQ